MFGFFKKKQPPKDPPTERQRKYAARLGIEVTPFMGKGDVSDAIYEAERRDPSLRQKRQQAKERASKAAEKAREEKFGTELIEQESQWNRFADEVGFILAVYVRGQNTIVDVLQVNEAFITERGKLKLGVAAPKVRKDRHLGDYLEWDRNFEMPASKLLYYEPLHADFYLDDNDVYRRTVERGLKIAKKLPKSPKT